MRDCHADTLLVPDVDVTAVMGKAEGDGENWHGHVSALTVAPEFRRLGLAERLMVRLADVSEHLCVHRSVTAGEVDAQSHS